ncbi:MAG: RNA polymerase sigma factor [Candidatus Cryptobacteroides sp.]|jgi:RNA polymerase sigma factor (sigma-70 family)
MTNNQRDSRQDYLVAEAYRDRYASVLRYICRRLGPGQRIDAEDLCQDVFVRLLQYDTFLNAENLPRLIYTIARNRVIDYLRRHIRTRAAQEYFFRSSPKSALTTEEQVIADELEQLENACIKRMPPRKAQVFVLYIHRGKSIEEISSSLDISPRTVENHIFRARMDVRDALKLVS